MIPTTSGVRSPGGIGFNADGDVFYTDNQGPWNGTCSLKWLRPGSSAIRAEIAGSQKPKAVRSRSEGARKRQPNRRRSGQDSGV